MARGKTTLHFRGGPNDGEAIEDVALYNVVPSLRYATGSGFTEEAKGLVGVFVNASTRPGNWLSYEVALYCKAEPVERQPGVYYDFTGMNTVHRCRAFTQTHSRCKNEALTGEEACRAHARDSNSAPLRLRP